MQDHNHISKEFLDKSWGEMNALLDKEMPVKSRRRGLLLWILSAVILLLLLLIVGLQYQREINTKERLASERISEFAANNPESKVESISSAVDERIKEDKVVLDSEPSNNELDNSQSKIVKIEEERIVSNFIRPSLNSEQELDNQNQITENDIISTQEKFLNDNSIITNENAISQVDYFIAEGDASDIKNENPESERAGILMQELPAGSINELGDRFEREIFTYNPISLPFSLLLDRRNLNDNPLFASVEEKIVVRNSTPKTWHIGLEGSALSDNLDAFNGMGLSIFADYELNERYRFGFHFGYNLFDYNQTNNNTLEDLANAGTELSSGTGSFEFAQLSYSDAVELLDGGKFLNSELRAGVQVVNRLYLETGISYSYFLDATNDENIILPASSPVADFESFAISSRTLKDNSLVNRSQWSGLLGLEWKLVDRVGLNFSYYHGLETMISRSVARSNLLNSEGEDIHNRYYKAGLKIYF